MPDLRGLQGLPLTFYGHFTGFSSYPVVCYALAQWMLNRGVALQVCNLRDGKLPTWLEEHQINTSIRAGVLNSASGAAISRNVGDPKDPPDRTDAIGMLFGFPSWLPFLPAHHPMIGYHVADVQPLPPWWRQLIEENTDLVLTPSAWCRNMLLDLDMPQEINVVRHGIDPQVFCLGDKQKVSARVDLLHFCSAQLLAVQRKGTDALAVLAKQWLSEPVVDHDGKKTWVDLALYAEAAVNQHLKSFEGTYPGGHLGMRLDNPGPQGVLARKLQEASGLIQPARAEGFGLLPLEAVACGTPALMLGQTGDAEFVDDLGEAAVRVDSSGIELCGYGEAPAIDMGSLLVGLERMVTERRELQEAARVASPTIREQWSWDTVLDRELAPVLLRAAGMRPA